MKSKRSLQNTKKAAKKPKQLKETSEESYESEGESVAEPKVIVEENEEDIDERRLKLAKRIISEAKESLKQSSSLKKLKDSFLVHDEDNYEDGPSALDEADQVTGYLQHKLQAKSKKLQTKLYNQIYNEYLANNRTLKSIILKGHMRPITACCFHPQTHDLLTVSKDGSIILFDYASGFKRRLLNPGYPKDPSGHADEILCLDVSFDGRYLITAGKDRVIKVWNLELYVKELAEMKKEIALGDFAMIANGKILPVSHNKRVIERKSSVDSASAKSNVSQRSKERPRQNSLDQMQGGKSPAQIAEVLTRHPTLQLITTLKGHKEAINTLKFRINSYECVSGSSDFSMKTWDVSQGGMLETFFGHRSHMIDLCPLGDQNVVSVGYDKVSIVWKLDKETQMVYDEQPYSLDCVFALSAHFFITGSQSGQVALWNIGKKKPLQQIAGFESTGWVSSITGLYNGDFFIVGAREGLAKLYHVGIKSPKDYSISEGFDIPAEGVISSMQVSSDGRWLAVVEGPENRLGRWTVESSVRSKVRLIKLFSDNE